MKKKYISYILLAAILFFSACESKQDRIKDDDIKVNSSEKESDENNNTNSVISDNKEKVIQNEDNNEEKNPDTSKSKPNSSSNKNSKNDDMNTVNPNTNEKNQTDSDTNNATSLSVKSGEYLLSEAFNNKQRVDLILKGEGEVKYFIDDVQVFGGYYLDDARIRLIVSGNCKLLISGDLSGKIISVNSTLDTNHLTPGMYEAGKDFPLGTYEINLLIQTEPSSLTILENLKSLEIAQNTLIDSTSGNGDQYSIDKEQILILENIKSGQMIKK